MAAHRFHIHPETGNVAICRADPSNPRSRGCRFGEISHYGSKAEAMAAYEAAQQSQLPEASTSLDVQLKANGYLREEFEELVRPRDISCPGCGKPISIQTASVLISDDDGKCESCGKKFHISEAKIELTPGNPSYRFLKKEEVLKATWYHATSREDWLSEIEDYGDGSSLEVHLGTESAAFDRAIGEYAGHGSFAEPFYLYEVSVAPDAQIADRVAKDENGKLLQKETDDVVRYINRWEDMASISLALKPEKTVVRSRRLVSPEEAHRRLSVYNVDPNSESFKGSDEHADEELDPIGSDWSDLSDYEAVEDEESTASQIFELAMEISRQHREGLAVEHLQAELEELKARG